jgi:hypothetical protein
MGWWAAGRGGSQRGVDPDLGLRAGRCSLEDLVRGGVEEAGGAHWR